MKFSPRKKSKMRKVRFERNKRTWSGCYWGNIEGNEVIDKMSIGQTLYLLVDGKYFYSIYRVGARGELTELSPKKILGKRGAFQKASKWFNKSKIDINDEGTIMSVEKENDHINDFSGFMVIITD